MTTSVFDQLSMVEPRQRVKLFARMKLLRRAAKPQQWRCVRSKPTLRLVQQLLIVCRSQCVQVSDNLRNRHPLTDGGNFCIAIGIVNSNDLDLTSFGAGCYCLVFQTAAGGTGSGLNVNKCLHDLAPVEVFILAHDALIERVISNYFLVGNPNERAAA